MNMKTINELEKIFSNIEKFYKDNVSTFGKAPSKKLPLHTSFEKK